MQTRIGRTASRARCPRAVAPVAMACVRVGREVQCKDKVSHLEDIQKTKHPSELRRGWVHGSLREPGRPGS